MVADDANFTGLDVVKRGNHRNAGIETDRQMGGFETQRRSAPRSHNLRSSQRNQRRKK